MQKMNMFKNFFNGTKLNVDEVMVVNENKGQLLKHFIVCESGLNFIKFGDGTMICFQNKNVSLTLDDYYSFCKRSNAVSITFPQSFKEVPVVLTGIKNFQFFGERSENVTTTKFDFRVLAPPTVAATSCQMSYVAIGKWK